MHVRTAINTVACIALAAALSSGVAVAQFGSCTNCVCCENEYIEEKERCDAYHSDIVKGFCVWGAQDDFKRCNKRVGCAEAVDPGGNNAFLTPVFMLDTGQSCKTGTAIFDSDLGAGLFYFYLSNGSNVGPNSDGVDDVVVELNGTTLVPTGTIDKTVSRYETTGFLETENNNLTVTICEADPNTVNYIVLLMQTDSTLHE